MIKKIKKIKKIKIKKAYEKSYKMTSNTCCYFIGSDKGKTWPRMDLELFGGVS